jgi:hypothetical protein
LRFQKHASLATGELCLLSTAAGQARRRQAILRASAPGVEPDGAADSWMMSPALSSIDIVVRVS